MINDSYPFSSGEDSFFSKSLILFNPTTAEDSLGSIGEFAQNLFQNLGKKWVIYLIPSGGDKVFECRIARPLPLKEGVLTPEVKMNAVTFTAARARESITKSLQLLTKSCRSESSQDHGVKNSSIFVPGNSHLALAFTVSSDTVVAEDEAVVIERADGKECGFLTSRRVGVDDPVFRDYFIRRKTLTLLHEEASLEAIKSALPYCNLPSLTEEELQFFQKRIPQLATLIASEKAEERTVGAGLLQLFLALPTLPVKEELKNRCTCGVIRHLLLQSGGVLSETLLSSFIQLTEAASLKQLPSKPWALLLRDLILNTPSIGDRLLFSELLQKIEKKMDETQDFSKLLQDTLPESSSALFYCRAILFFDSPFYVHRLLEIPFDPKQGENFPALPNEQKKKFDAFYSRSLAEKKGAYSLNLIKYQYKIFGSESCYPCIIPFCDSFIEDNTLRDGVFDWLMGSAPEYLPLLLAECALKNKGALGSALIAKLGEDENEYLSAEIQRSVAKALLQYLEVKREFPPEHLEAIVNRYFSLLPKEDLLSLSGGWANEDTPTSAKLFSLALPELDREILWTPSQDHALNRNWFAKLSGFHAQGLVPKPLFARYVEFFWNSILEDVTERGEFLRLLYPYLDTNQKESLSNLFESAVIKLRDQIKRGEGAVREKNHSSQALKWLTLLPESLIHSFLAEQTNAALSYLDLVLIELKDQQRIHLSVVATTQFIISFCSKDLGEEGIRKITPFINMRQMNLIFEPLIGICLARVKAEKKWNLLGGAYAYINFLISWIPTNRNSSLFPIVEEVIQETLDLGDHPLSYRVAEQISELSKREIELFKWEMVTSSLLRNSSRETDGLLKKIIPHVYRFDKSILSSFFQQARNPEMKFDELVARFSIHFSILEKVEFDDEVGAFTRQIVDKFINPDPDAEAPHICDETYSIAVRSNPNAKLLTGSLVRTFLKGGLEYSQYTYRVYSECHFRDLCNEASASLSSSEIELYLDCVAGAIKHGYEGIDWIKHQFYSLLRYEDSGGELFTSELMGVIRRKIKGMMRDSAYNSPVTTILALDFLEKVLRDNNKIDRMGDDEILSPSGLALTIFEYAIRFPALSPVSGENYSALAVLSKWCQYLQSRELRCSNEVIHRINEVDRRVTGDYYSALIADYTNQEDLILSHERLKTMYAAKIISLFLFKHRCSFTCRGGIAFEDLKDEETVSLLIILINLGPSYIKEWTEICLSKNEGEVLIRRVTKKMLDSGYNNPAFITGVIDATPDELKVKIMRDLMMVGIDLTKDLIKCAFNKKVIN